jgi:hypothetical protein
VVFEHDVVAAQDNAAVPARDAFRRSVRPHGTPARRRRRADLQRLLADGIGDRAVEQVGRP